MRPRERDRKRSCAGKLQTFRTADVAKAVAAGLPVEALGTRGPLVPYYCRFGDHWHIGHSRVRQT